MGLRWRRPSGDVFVAFWKSVLISCGLVFGPRPRGYCGTWVVSGISRGFFCTDTWQWFFFFVVMFSGLVVAEFGRFKFLQWLGLGSRVGLLSFVAWDLTMMGAGRYKEKYPCGRGAVAI